MEAGFDKIRDRINDPVTFALLVGKSSRARELGIEYHINPDSVLTVLPQTFSSGDMVLVLGNLIENAIEAVSIADERIIEIGIFGDGDKLIIQIVNSGPQIDESLGDSIYRRGVTTKEGARGYGLALVSEKLAAMGGTIRHRNRLEGGVEFRVEVFSNR